MLDATIRKRNAFEEVVAATKTIPPDTAAAVYDTIITVQKDYNLGLDSETHKTIKDLTSKIAEFTIDTYMELEESLLSEKIASKDVTEKILAAIPSRKKPDDSVAEKLMFLYNEVYATTRLEAKKETLRYINSLKDDVQSETRIKNIVTKYGHKRAFIFVLGYNPKNKDHTRHAFKGYDTQDPHHEFTRSIGKNIKNNREPELASDLIEISKEDNATLITKDGTIYGLMKQLAEFDVNQAASYVEKNNLTSLTKLIGHSRGFFTWLASYHLKNTVTIKLGESGLVEAYYAGYNIFRNINDERKQEDIIEVINKLNA